MALPDDRPGRAEFLVTLKDRLFLVDAFETESGMLGLTITVARKFEDLNDDVRNKSFDIFEKRENGVTVGFHKSV